MTTKWYPNIVDIIEDSIIIFDTSALLNVYRYSLVSSKRILNHVKHYEDKLWIPAQVKNEFLKNKDNVRSVNLYKNLDKKIIKHVENKRDELLVQLSEYEKKRFPNFNDLKSKLELKFSEMDEIIKEYKTDISEETGVYKDFIEEVDNFLDSLLESEKVGRNLNLIELMEVLKEGELRYRYNLPPGYEDTKTKEGIDKFGDLIMWKQLLKYSSDIDKKNIIFTTSDTKPDWFQRNNQNQIVSPREELLSEFNQQCGEKEIIIIPFDNFIEEISDSSDISDRDLLLELRANNLIKRLSKDVFENIIEEKIKSVEIDDIHKKMLQSSNEMNYYYIRNLKQIYDPNIENISINSNGVRVEGNDIIYSLKVNADCVYDTVSSSSDLISYGIIQTELTLNVELKRKLEDSEVTFINNFKENTSDTITATHFIIDKEQYIWGADDDLIDDEDDVLDIHYYNICPTCSGGINISNDAGNGFCIKCSQ